MDENRLIEWLKNNCLKLLTEVNLQQNLFNNTKNILIGGDEAVGEHSAVSYHHDQLRLSASMLLMQQAQQQNQQKKFDQLNFLLTNASGSGSNDDIIQPEQQSSLGSSTTNVNLDNHNLMIMVDIVTTGEPPLTITSAAHEQHDHIIQSHSESARNALIYVVVILSFYLLAVATIAIQYYIKHQTLDPFTAYLLRRVSNRVSRYDRRNRTNHRRKKQQSFLSLLQPILGGDYSTDSHSSTSQMKKSFGHSSKLLFENEKSQPEQFKQVHQPGTKNNLDGCKELQPIDDNVILLSSNDKDSGYPSSDGRDSAGNYSNKDPCGNVASCVSRNDNETNIFNNKDSIIIIHNNNAVETKSCNNPKQRQQQIQINIEPIYDNGTTCHENINQGTININDDLKLQQTAKSFETNLSTQPHKLILIDEESSTYGDDDEEEEEDHEVDDEYDTFDFILAPSSADLQAKQPQQQQISASSFPSTIATSTKQRLKNLFSFGSLGASMSSPPSLPGADSSASVPLANVQHQKSTTHSAKYKCKLLMRSLSLHTTLNDNNNSPSGSMSPLQDQPVLDFFKSNSNQKIVRFHKLHPHRRSSSATTSSQSITASILSINPRRYEETHL